MVNSPRRDDYVAHNANFAKLFISLHCVLMNNLNEMKTDSILNSYEAPKLLCIECCIEQGFNISDLSKSSGSEVPDFIDENTL